MRIAEIMIVFAWSSMSITFPWYLWLLALWDVFVRISDDYQGFLKAKQSVLKKEIQALEEQKQNLTKEIRRIRVNYSE
ncbi:MAG: hypothetical protein HQM08_26825 [Candidatus Riflebacteria bacterium]|nr:hypothetical protein [Candidatus Riflebacteria bacterium]